MSALPLCRVCKKADPVLCFPQDHTQTICPECCDKAEHSDGETGHVWKYDRGERGNVCDKCGILQRDTQYNYDYPDW